MSSLDADRRDELLARLMADYDEALAQDPLTPRIDESAVAEDPELAAQWQVEKQWLEELDRARRTSQLGPAPLESTSDNRPSLQIGRFVIERELGRGGLGIVYLARDPQLDRWVALKVPRFEAVLNDELRQRFLREAEAAARLSHPNIATLLEVGEASGTCYLAAEYCPGPTLAEWLESRGHQVEPRDAAVLLLALAEAVQHAHSRGVLHRDIKPSNVLMAPQEAGESADAWSPRLTDFGLAKLLEQTEDDRTRTGVILGTPAYMAPEQVEGRVSDLDTRTDVYGLGAVLYELLAGIAPYRGQSEIDTLRQLIAAEPVPPRKLRPHLPRDLEAIALKCLAKNPAQRYQTAVGLAQDLRRYLAGEPTVARPPGWVERTTKWSRRHPAASTAALIGMLALVVLSVGGWVTTAQTRSALALAEARRVHAEASEAAAARSELAARRLLYTSEVAQAATAWDANEPALARELLAHWIPQPGETDRREFAWHHLWAKTHEEERIFRGHTADVLCVRYSPDGQLLASSSRDHSIRLWNAQTGVPVATLQEHTDEVSSLAVLPGDQLVSIGNDGRLLLWDTAQHKLVRELFHGAHPLYALAVSADQRLLAVGGLEPEVLLFRVQDWERLPSIKGPWQEVRALKFSADGRTLFTGSDDGPIRVWRTDGPRLLGVLTGHPSCVRGLALTDDDRRLVSVGREDRTLRVWNLPRWEDEHTLTIEPVRNMSPHADWLQDVALGPNPKSAVAAGRDGAVHQLNLETGKVERTFDGHDGRVWSICFAPDGKHLVTAGEDRTIRIWSAHGDRSHTRYQIPNANFAAMQFDRNGAPIAIHSGRRNGLAINLQDGSHLAELASPHYFERDFDGDGCPDKSEYIDGVWTIRFANHTSRTLQLGSPADDPLVGDWNGDGKCDVAIYRDQVFRLYCNLDKLEPSAPTRTVTLTESPQRVVVGDWNGDGCDEIGYFTEQGLFLDTNLGGGEPEWHQVQEGTPLEHYGGAGRYIASELLDSTFGDCGRVDQIVDGADAAARCLALTADGKIITAGRCADEKDAGRMFVACLRSDGTRDESFGQHGVVLGPSAAEAYAVSALADGKIVVAGNRTVPSGDPTGCVMRYLSNGQIDGTYRGSALGYYTSLAVQPDGKLVLAGLVFTPEHRNCLAVFRLTKETGEPDPTFADGGRRRVPLADSSGAWRVALQPDGKILVAGYQNLGPKVQGVVIRLLPTGELDKSFGKEGTTVIYPELRFAAANRVLVLANGRILVSCETKENNGTRFALMLLDTNGQIDASFGDSGRAVVPPAAPPHSAPKRTIDLSQALALNSKGTILAGGHEEYHISMAGYDAAGNLREQRGEPGIITSGGLEGMIVDLAIDATDRVVALVHHPSPSRPSTSLCRLLSTPPVLEKGTLAIQAAWQHRSPLETGSAAVTVTQSAATWAVGFHQHGIVRYGRLGDTGESKTIGPMGFSLDRIALSDDGQRLAVTSDRGALEIWDVATNKKLAALDGNEGPMPPPVFSPTGKLLAFCKQPGRIMLWDFVHSAPHSVDQTAMEDSEALCFSQDDRKLATGNTDRGIKIWNVASGKQIARLAGQKSKVWALAFSLDGRTLASGGNNSIATLWDLETNEKLCELHGQAETIHALRFRADGKVLASGGVGDVDVWSAVDSANDQQTMR